MLEQNFFQRSAAEVAPDLLGHVLCVQQGNTVWRGTINETEAYLGEQDLACHASKGRTKRTEVMYTEAGHIYMYLIYGMYWMLNIVCEKKDVPQAVLVRGAGEYDGPGKLTKALGLEKSSNNKKLSQQTGIWVESGLAVSDHNIVTTPRVNVDYANEWVDKPLRFKLE